MKLQKIVYSVIATSIMSAKVFAGGDIVPVVPIDVVPKKTPVFYIGAGLVATGLSRDCPCNGTRLKDMTYGGVVKLGANLTENIALEVRYIKSTIESDFSEVEHYGLYLKPQFMIDDDVKLYALLGYGQTNIDYAAGSSSSTLDESGASFGGGLEYTLDNNMGFWIDMQHIFSNEGLYNTDLNLGTAGLMYNF